MGYKLKRIMMWVNNATRGLPAEYQEVEYIESTGTQYIDTGVSAPNGFKSQLKICITGQVGQTLIGSHNVNSPYGRNNINTYTSGATWGLHMNDEMINGLGSIVIGQDCEIEMSTILGASYLTVDGIRLTNGTNTSPMSANNILILQNQYGIAHGDSCNKAKIYYCKIYDSSETLVRDFVPCYRKADDIIGLYDLVNDQFYTNSGSGTFTKGADIPDMLEKQVRPTSYKYSYNFVGKTTSQMETDGWVFYLNKDYATFNSNGINTTLQDKPPLAGIDNLSSVISTAKKITISSTGNFIYKFRSEVYLYNSFSSGRYTNAYGQGISLAENSIGVMINNNSISTGRTISGVITQTTVFDLENLTWSGTATNGYSNSGTLTSSDVTNIRNLKGIGIAPSWGGGGNSSGGMTSISLEIEY